MPDVFTASKRVLAMFVSIKEKAMWGAPRSISTEGRKGSSSTPSERLQSGERGFRESTAFYSLSGRLREVAKNMR